MGVLAHSVYRRNTFGDVSLRSLWLWGDVFGDFVCLYSVIVGAEGNRNVFREMTSHTPYYNARGFFDRTGWESEEEIKREIECRIDGLISL